MNLQKLGLIGAALGALVASAPAHSAVIYLDAVTAVGSNFRYDYSVEFARDEGIESGSSFAIYDFNGYVPGSIKSDYPGFVTSRVERFSDLPKSPNFTDDNTFNLRFTYNGPTQNLSRQSFGMFSALSRFENQTVDGFSAVTVVAAGSAAGEEVFAQGPVETPAAAVPETATWAMMISGLGLIGGAMRRQRKVKTTVRFA
jgi:hypothetical protein